MIMYVLQYEACMCCRHKRSCTHARIRKRTQARGCMLTCTYNVQLACAHRQVSLRTRVDRHVAQTHPMLHICDVRFGTGASAHARAEKRSDPYGEEAERRGSPPQY